MKESFLVREIQRSDLRQVAALETRLFADPWSEGTLSSCIDDLFLIAEREGKVSGYLVARDSGTEAEILTFGVDPALRRRGVGSALLTAVADRLEQVGVRKLYLECRVSNVPAISFYLKHGFLEVGKWANYYRSPRENGVVMCRKIGPV